MQFFFLASKNPSQAANNGVCLLVFTHFHIQLVPKVQNLQNPALKPPKNLLSRYKECYSVEDEAQRPPSSRSLSMVINRYGPCPCLPASATGSRPWVRGGRSDGTGAEDDPLHRRFEVGAAGGAQFEPAGPMRTNPPHPSIPHQPQPPT